MAVDFSTGGYFSTRPSRPLLDGRRLVLLLCVAGLAIDFVLVARGAYAAHVATALAFPLTLLATLAAAWLAGMWVGAAIAAVGAIGGTLLLAPSFGIETTAFEIVIGGLVGRIRDITFVAREREYAHARRHARHRALAAHAGEIALVLDSAGYASYASDTHARLLGHESDAMLGAGYRSVWGAPGAAFLTEAFTRDLRVAPHRVELTVAHADGSPRIFEVTLDDRRADDAVEGYLFCARDVTERKAAEARLVEARAHDALTGLPNRVSLCARLNAMIANNAISVPALLLINLDRFKDVSDVMGHAVGDALLCEVAQRLRAWVRDCDVAARIGDDAFAIILGRTHDSNYVIAAAEHARAEIIAPYVLAGRDLVIGASVGIAFSLGANDAAAMLRHADVAMHAAKRRRSGVAIFAKLQDERATRRLTMASALHTAIDNDELLLHYQPQIDARTGEVCGAEALVRWEHAERGLLYPDYFLPIAEEVGEMDRLTEWILHAAIKRVRDWDMRGHRLRIAVNLSAHDLRDDRLMQIVPRMLARYNVAPSALCLELTETTVVTEKDSAAHCLRGLSELGVRISIDDFGTGYSAIAHLKQFPVDEIKIDKQFVMNMENDVEDAAIVASTIELAHRLAVDVVVEGVERATTLEAVRRLGAEYAQGYAIGRPLGAAAFEAWLAERRGTQRIAATG